MRKNRFRFVQGLVAATAVLALAGAKGEGCGGEVIGPGEEEPTATCDAGFHMEAMCADPIAAHPACPPCGEPVCEDVCVPDEGCPEGTVGELICPGPEPELPPGEPMPDRPACAEEGELPPPPPCFFECVPENDCGPGFHRELVCGPVPPPPGEEPPPPPPADPDSPDETPPEPGEPPMPECEEICVPDQCPPGTFGELICHPPDEPLPPGVEPCRMECLPGPICPPGTFEEVICHDEQPGLPPGEDPLPPGEDPCWVECVPEPMCPPGTIDHLVCADEAEPLPPGVEPCWVECLPAPECPPGTMPQEMCHPVPEGEFPDENTCWLECVPEPQCPPGQHIDYVCLNAPGHPEPEVCELTCVDDLPEPPPEPAP